MTTDITQPYINTRCLSHRVTGVQRYVLGLMPHLQDRLASIQPGVPSQGIRGHLWEQFVLPRKVRGKLLWSPANTGPLSVERQVVTVHDAATLDHPEWFDGKFARWYRFMLPRLMKKARRIITVSEFSRRRLIEAAGLPEEKVVAILNGAEDRLRPVPTPDLAEFLLRRDLAQPYFLCVASLEPRKNLRRLFSAWERCQPEGTELVIAGAAGHVFRSQGFAESSPGVRFLGHVDDADLPYLYSGARAFVFPSVYEGFGLPPLEAMACGCPVLSSSTTSLPEVCGPAFEPDQPGHPGAVFYFDPHDPDAIADAITRLIRLSDVQRQTMVQNGLDRARQFSWQNAARATWQVLTQCA